MDGGVHVECNPRYLLTIPGILKIVEIVLTILTFALSFGGYWAGYGGGWVKFCGISCCLTIAVWLVLHLLNVIPQISANYLIELMKYCVMTVMLLIGGIVAAADAGDLAYTIYWHPWYRQRRDAIAACSFFAFASALVCGVDTMFQIVNYRSGNFQSSTTSSSSTTVTRTTVSAVKVEY